jgi:hypothetical protein
MKSSTFKNVSIGVSCLVTSVACVAAIAGSLKMMQDLTNEISDTEDVPDNVAKIDSEFRQ